MLFRKCINPQISLNYKVIMCVVHFQFDCIRCFTIKTIHLSSLLLHSCVSTYSKILQENPTKHLYHNSYIKTKPLLRMVMAVCSVFTSWYMNCESRAYIVFIIFPQSFHSLRSSKLVSVVIVVLQIPTRKSRAETYIVQE